MLSIASNNRYEFVKLRKQHSFLILLCGTFTLLLPITCLLLYILFHSCSPQIIDKPASVEQHWSIPQWIGQRSQRNLSPSVSNGDDSNYEEAIHATIFVSIAAYRDPECGNTVLQVFENAAYPDRLRVGIFTQNNVSADPDCADFRDSLNCDPTHRDYSYLYQHDNDNHINHRDTPHVLCGRQWQIKADRVDWRDGLGPTYGRYRSELFYDGEDYVLQMDSHTAFVEHWDVILISMHQQLGNEYGVLTTYPKPLRCPSLWHWKAPPVRSNSDMYVICSTQILTEKVTKSFKLRPAKVIKNAGQPILSAFFAAGFSFQRAHRVEKVPYDPYSAFLFDGEEMSMAARMWTHGYDFYTPHLDVVYHLYSPNDAKIRPVFWETDWNRKWKIARDSEYRINYILGLHARFHPFVKLSQYDLREIDKYGLGHKRDIEQFWNFTQIDLDNLKSNDLCDLYKRPGAMHHFRVPWKNNTQDPYHPVSYKPLV